MHCGLNSPRPRATAADRVLLAAITQPGLPVVSVDWTCDRGDTVAVVTVRRFDAGGTGGASASAGPWPMPIGIRGVGTDAPTLVFSTQLLAEPRQPFRIPGCFPAVIVNAGALGYFRTAHTPDALSHLAELARERLTPAERVQLLNDAGALAGIGAQGVGDYLALVNGLAADPTPEVVEEIARGLTSIRDGLAPGRGLAPFEAWIAKAFGPVEARLGWHVAPADSADRRRLRAAVLDVMGSVGRDPTVLATARALAAAWFAGGPPLDRSLAPVVIRLAARSAGPDLLARLQSRDARRDHCARRRPVVRHSRPR